MGGIYSRIQDVATYFNEFNKVYIVCFRPETFLALTESI